ncbi:MAG: hypothetical protein JWM00_633 [Candidatus Saccharibacteria bacterium]|nr:hypothetical protein [Candidatus Saccharibacteria bacterium]
MLLGMASSRGFTIIELLITITVMLILIMLAVVNLRSTQLNARDSDRKSDVESIARRLDSLYKTGYPTTVALTQYSYPSQATIVDDATSRQAIFSVLPDGVLVDPLSSATSSIVKATNLNTGLLSAGATPVTPFPSATNPYVYQPISTTGVLCTTTALTCRSFNLYYWSEVTPTTAAVVKSIYR